MIKLLLYLGGGFILFDWLRSIPEKVVDSFKFSVSNLRFDSKNSGIFSTKLFATVTIQNEMPVTLNVESLKGNAETNGQKIGEIIFTKAFSVPANGSVETTIEITATNSSLFQQISLALINLKKPEIFMVGQIETSIGTFPVNYPIL